MSDHRPIESAYRADMNHLARLIDSHFNGRGTDAQRKVGFVLLVVPFSDDPGARCSYISNCDRQDITALFKEMIARFEGQPLTPGRG